MKTANWKTYNNILYNKLNLTTKQIVHLLCKLEIKDSYTVDEIVDAYVKITKKSTPEITDFKITLIKLVTQFV